jgi:hypothetical protein
VLKLSRAGYPGGNDFLGPRSAPASGRYRQFVESVDELLGVDADVVFTDLIEWVFEVGLDVVQAYQNQTEQNGQDECEKRG